MSKSQSPFDRDFTGTPRFEVIKRLGAGGMGVVYDALDRELNTHVALKTMQRVNADALLSFKNEFRALQDLHHPNLIRLGELIEEDGQWFFTMELIDGSDLVSYVRNQSASTQETDPFAKTNQLTGDEELGKEPCIRTTVKADIKPSFDEERLRHLLPQLAEAICTLHGANKVHRDIKPSNILVTEKGRVVLLDFGLVAEAIASDEEESIVGTAAYMAPEQAASSSVTPAADWYSVGILLYEVMTGRLPFVGTPLQISMDKQKHEPPPPRALVPDVPRDLDALCVDLLRFLPKDRPSGRDVLRRLGVTDADRIAPATISSSLDSSVFVGREAELEILEAAFRSTQEGKAVTVYVRGESGVGKSALIGRFTKTLNDTQADVVVLRGRCYERETVPYKAFDGVADALSSYMRSLPRDLVAELVPTNALLLPRVFPVLGRVGVIAAARRRWKNSLDPAELRSRAFGALRELLFRLAERHPLVLVIDDLQWADGDSLLLLNDLLRDPDPPPLLLLVSARIETDAATSKHLAIPGDVRQIDLDLLGSEAACELATRLIEKADLGSKIDARSIALEAQGHPLYVDELVRHAALLGGSQTKAPKLEEAIWARVSTLRPEALNVLELVCLAGAPLPLQIVFDATDMSESPFAQQVSLLRVANLVRGQGGRRKDTIECYHDRVRDAVVQNLDDDTRRSHHMRISESLESSSMAQERPELLLQHFEAAGRHAKGAQYAQEAAKRAIEAFAFEQASEFYRTAMRLGEYEGEELRALQIALGLALSQAGHGAQAADAFFAAAEGADPTTRLECQHRAAYQLLITGFIERGVESFRSVLEEVGVGYPKTPRKALWSLISQTARLRLRGYGWERKHESEVPRSVLAKLDVYQDAAAGFSMVDSVRAFDFQTRGVALALDTGEPFRALRGLIYHTTAFANGNSRIAQGRKLLESVRQQVADLDNLYMSGLFRGMDGCMCFFEGRYVAAYDLLREGDEMLAESPRTTWGERNAFQTFELFCLHLTGRFREMEERYSAYLLSAQRRGDLYAETTMRRYCNTVWLLKDDPARARKELEESSWTAPTHAFHLQHYFEWRAEVYLMLYEGQELRPMSAMRDTFRALKKSMLTKAIQGLRSEANWLWGQVCLSEAQRHGNAIAMRQAAKVAKQLLKEKRGYASAMGLLIRAGVEFQKGSEDKASETLQRAALVAGEHDLFHMQAAANYQRGKLVGGEEGAELISSADLYWRSQGGVDSVKLSGLVAPGFSASK